LGRAVALEILIVADVLGDPYTSPPARVGRRHAGRREQAFQSKHKSVPLFRFRLRRYEEIHCKETKGLRPP